MAIPSIIVVMMAPIASVEDLDTLTTLLLVVLAAGVGWFLWRRT
jgi:hypothetical protein